jgi:hypothetical protein
VNPGNTNAPIVFEPSSGLTGGATEVWIIASGGADWGGCQVWISTDGNTYGLAGTIYRGGRQGVLTASLPAATDPDTADTLAVDLTQSQGQLLSGTRADADAYVTLCYCDGELVSYETATLTAPYKYGLTYLRRGAYGTAIGTHAGGAQFARFGPNDPSLFRYAYPVSFIGHTIFIKLPGFNIFGQELQGLAGLSASSYTLLGTGGLSVNIVAALASGIAQDWGIVGPASPRRPTSRRSPRSPGTTSTSARRSSAESVITAQAGTQGERSAVAPWTPACAGVTSQWFDLIGSWSWRQPSLAVARPVTGEPLVAHASSMGPRHHRPGRVLHRTLGRAGA